MIKKHKHDLAFLGGGEGVYCMDADCGFTLVGDELLAALKAALVESEDEFWSRFWEFIGERADDEYDP